VAAFQSWDTGINIYVDLGRMIVKCLQRTADLLYQVSSAINSFVLLLKTWASLFKVIL